MNFELIRRSTASFAIILSLTVSGLNTLASGIPQTQAHLVAQQTLHIHEPDQEPDQESDLDTIYHEDNNLPDDADVFPRMGKIEGTEQNNTHCRSAPWGQIITTFPGNGFVEIDRRTTDRNGESWFHVGDRNCWIHDSRIDLL